MVTGCHRNAQLGESWKMEIQFTTLAREGSECRQRRGLFVKRNSLYAVSFVESHLLSDKTMGVVAEDSTKVNVEETVEMLPKSRKALTIQEIAALARSSLYGISQVVKDHVTKPTAMAQGRVAHLIEWKGWCRPCDSASALESHFRSYSHLTEGEQEARFAAGVAEQFAIAEAKLRAWSSLDGEDSYEDSCDEDAMPYGDTNMTTQSGDSSLYPQCSQDLWPRPSEDCPAPSGTLSSSTPGPEDRPLPENSPSSPFDMGPLREAQDQLEGEEEEEEEEEDEEAGDCAPHRPSRGVSQDSAYAPSSCLSFPDAEDEFESSDRDALLLGNAARRKISDEPSSGAMSLEEEEEEEEDQKDRVGEHGHH